MDKAPAKRKIAGLLSAASCSLLGSSQQAAAGEWDIDSAVLYYSETDRVTAVEPAISATKDLGDDESLSMKLVLDSLTGASANGAVPSTMVQTFTTPSGARSGGDDDDDDEGRGGFYTVAPNETPLDDTFEDTRISYSLNWDKPTDRNNRRNLGFAVSAESDFFSISGNAGWQHDMNQKNTALTTGINIELDKIDPEGGVPVVLSNMLDQRRESGTESRDVVDLLLGITQIINRSSLFQVNLSLSEADGYMTDPYKFVSVVDSVSGEPVRQLFENRPTSRSRQSLYGKYRKMLPNRDILTASYRYMTDDWGVESNTYDLSYRLSLNSGYYLQPHLRFYEQSAADFYRYFLVDGETVPTDVSADYRLGEMEATTIGFKFGREYNEQHSWSLRLEQYVQSGDSSPAEAFGQLDQQDLYPDVEAAIVQFNYSFVW